MLLYRAYIKSSFQGLTDLMGHWERQGLYPTIADNGTRRIPHKSGHRPYVVECWDSARAYATAMRKK